MATGSGHGSGGLAPADRERLAALRAATRLSDLVALTDAASEHDAYLAAKREWRELRTRELEAAPRDAGLPGARVAVDDHEFHVHGVTHADTAEERAFLREHVKGFLEEGATVYCEQGIRSMYFDDLGAVCAMDDYSWASTLCEELGFDSRVTGPAAGSFDGLAENVDSLAARIQDAAFSLIVSGRDLYGERFAAALGDVASTVLTSHADAAIADDFESFRIARAAASDPSRLGDLQRYYEAAFLPQPPLREWLRQHDPELEMMTHARNERMADYAVFHAESAARVHLVVGAAHQPGVRYYLERHRDDERRVDGFEPVG